MTKSRKFVFALAGLAVLCVCAAMAAPLATGDGAGRGGMMQDGNGAQVALEKMQANGVDTTELEAALENGDREAVRAFLQENRPADAPAMNEDRSAMNEERMQQMIQKMQANGVDTTALETALENGDREAVHTFMQENRPADAGTGFRHGGPSSE
jgi:SOS response regulatory protein OraA/RecX